MLLKETEVAKHHIRNKDQKRALIALKKKKYQEALLLQTDMQLLNLEHMVNWTTESMEFMDDVIPHPSFFNYHTYSTLTHTRPLGLGKTQTIEYSLIEKDIIAGLQKGNDVLKQIHLEMNVIKISQSF